MKEKCTDNLKREREIKDSGEREMEQAHGVGCMEPERSSRRLKLSEKCLQLLQSSKALKSWTLNKILKLPASHSWIDHTYPGSGSLSMLPHKSRVLLPAPAGGSRMVWYLHNLFQRNDPGLGLSSMIVTQATLKAAQQTLYLGGDYTHTQKELVIQDH